MPKKCELTGVSPLKGHNVSHSNNKTKRRFLPNLKKVNFRSELLKRNITVYDSLSLIFDRKIGNEQMHFAIGEARSHLINLVKTGYAKKISDSNKVEWFSLNN